MDDKEYLKMMSGLEKLAIAGVLFIVGVVVFGAIALAFFGKTF